MKSYELLKKDLEAEQTKRRAAVKRAAKAEADLVVMSEACGQSAAHIRRVEADAVLTRLGVGIGSSPLAKLHVDGDVAEGFPVLMLSGGTATMPDLVWPHDETFQFGTWNSGASTATMRLDVDTNGDWTWYNGAGDAVEMFFAADNGRLGIGVGTSPVGKLHVDGDADETFPVVYITGGTESRPDLAWPISEQFQIAAWDAGTDTDTQRCRINEDGDWNWYETTGTTVAFHWDAENSRVGINVAESPTEALHVGGNGLFSGTVTAQGGFGVAYDSGWIAHDTAVDGLNRDFAHGLGTSLSITDVTRFQVIAWFRDGSGHVFEYPSRSEAFMVKYHPDADTVQLAFGNSGMFAHDNTDLSGTVVTETAGDVRVKILLLT